MQGINFMLSLVINVKFEVIVGHGIYVHFRPVTPDQITPTMYRSLAGKTRVSERLCECSEVDFRTNWFEPVLTLLQRAA
jgi:hypothetical protein